MKACDTANRKAEPYSAEFRMITKDGRTIWVRNEANLVLGSKAPTSGAIPQKVRG